MKARAGKHQEIRIGVPWAACIVMSACVMWTRGVPAQAERTVDDEVFAAVLVALNTKPIPQGETRGKLTVDPRPIRDDASELSTRQAPFVPVSPVVLERRLDVMRRLAADSGDALFPEGCPGVLTPREPSSPPPSGCPRTARFVVAVSLTRVGDSDSTTLKPDSSFRTVRVVEAGIMPVGISAVASDYVLQHVAGQWTVVRTMARRFIE